MKLSEWLGGVSSWMAMAGCIIVVAAVAPDANWVGGFNHTTAPIFSQV